MESHDKIVNLPYPDQSQAKKKNRKRGRRGKEYKLEKALMKQKPGTPIQDLFKKVDAQLPSPTSKKRFKQSYSIMPNFGTNIIPNPKFSSIGASTTPTANSAFFSNTGPRVPKPDTLSR